MKPGKARVLASFSGESLAETRGMIPKTSGDIESGTIPGNAFLILQGMNIFPLKQSVVNIGRRLDNHVVIDDPRVSRNHAQLRAVRGHYILFDLNSTGGTYVNNERTTQSALNPGDVISLAGVMLIFGQDVPLRQAEPSIEDTAASPVVSELPTNLIPDSEKQAK
jgi:pSer/pThr/pTyr-binding forkhead associated (FHA) protein